MVNSPAVAPEETAVDPRVARSRAAVLQAAAELLIEQGSAGVTIEGVAERTRVAKTTIYGHWKSRSRLVLDNDVVELVAEEIAEVQDDRELSALESCLAALPARQREMIAARYEQGETVRAIAARRGSSMNESLS